MSTRIESRTFLWSSASFKIIKIDIKLPLDRRFEMNKTYPRVHFQSSALQAIAVRQTYQIW